jgi:hypothetical protein
MESRIGQDCPYAITLTEFLLSFTVVNDTFQFVFQENQSEEISFYVGSDAAVTGGRQLAC